MCENCQGEGRLLRSASGGNDPDTVDMGECPDCSGAGAVSSKLKVTNHERSARVMVIDFDEDVPIISLNGGESRLCQPKLIILPKSGRVSLSVEPERLKSQNEIQF